MALVHRVVARNDATESENRIHADDVARRHGFRGGLVPGVVTWGHLADAVVAALGPAWLQDGFMTARFVAPVYDGDELVVTLDPDGDAPDRVAITGNTAAGVVALGRAALLPPGGGQRSVEFAGPDPQNSTDLSQDRPPATPATLAPGTRLAPWRTTARSGHPGWLLRQANSILVANRRLGPWIHVESDVRHLGLVHEGDALVVCGVVSDERERKGRHFVDLDLDYVVNETRPVWHVRHTAIYDLGPGSPTAS